MREQIIVAEYEYDSKKFGRYKIKFLKPAAAKVDLVSQSTRPAHLAYLTTRAYKGIYSAGVSDYDQEAYPVEQAFFDMMNTKLQTPLEMIHTTWLLRDVTRAFTHQLVRYRVGTSFVQESMRFLGMKQEFKVLITHKAGEGLLNPTLYQDGAIHAIKNYVSLLENAVPSEDARGILPTNILTNIFFDCSFRTLQSIFPQRLCCQAQQGEWQPILLEMRSIIKNTMGEELEQLLRAPYELGKPCGYRASFDRPCIWQKEDSNART